MKIIFQDNKKKFIFILLFTSLLLSGAFLINALSSFQDASQINNTAINSPEKIITGQKQILYISDKKYEINIKENSTVYDLMDELKKRGDLDFAGKSSSGLGFFIEQINGIKNDPASNTYWFFYINGKSANVGISNYILMPDDIITWKYEKSQF